MEMKSIQKTLAIVAMAFAANLAYADDFATVIEGQIRQTVDGGSENEQTIKIAKGVKIGGGGSGSASGGKGFAGFSAEGGGGGGITQEILNGGSGNKQTIEIGFDK